MIKYFCLLLLSFSMSSVTFSQPKSLNDTISITKLISVPDDAVRLDFDPNTKELYYATISGIIRRVNFVTNRATTVFSSTHHGLKEVYGFEIGASGNMYLVGMNTANGNNIATIKRYANSEWTTMATATYPTSNLRDHRFNAIIETSDQQFVLINSGARTDHGEETNDGTRDIPLTTKIIKIPVDAVNLDLKNDIDFLTTNGYIYADGIRNTFDMEYAANGDLFGVENSDARDDEEEINWLKEGHHYGFPWRIGTNDNPQRFANFNPPTSDPLLIDGINMERTFYNDPKYPAIPAGVTFTEPIRNFGPDADIFRDTTDGKVKDASSLGLSIGSFTPHSSPLALCFDIENALPGSFKGKGFTMSYNDQAQRKYTPFNDPGEDLLMLDLQKENENYIMHTYRIASGFDEPIDAVVLGDKIYVMEYGSNSAIWEVAFVATVEEVLASEHPEVQVYPTIFSHEVFISAPSTDGQPIMIQIHSLEGKAIRTINLAAGSSSKASVIWEGTLENGSTVPSGLYLLSIYTPDKTLQYKLIKQ